MIEPGEGYRLLVKDDPLGPSTQSRMDDGVWVYLSQNSFGKLYTNAMRPMRDPLKASPPAPLDCYGRPLSAQKAEGCKCFASGEILMTGDCSVHGEAEDEAPTCHYCQFPLTLVGHGIGWECLDDASPCRKISDGERLKRAIGRFAGDPLKPLDGANDATKKTKDMVWEIESLKDAAEKAQRYAGRLAGQEGGRDLRLLSVQLDNIAESLKQWPAIAALRGERSEPSKSPSPLVKPREWTLMYIPQICHTRVMTDPDEAVPDFIEKIRVREIPPGEVQAPRDDGLIPVTVNLPAVPRTKEGAEALGRVMVDAAARYMAGEVQGESKPPELVEAERMNAGAMERIEDLKGRLIDLGVDPNLPRGETQAARPQLWPPGGPDRVNEATGEATGAPVSPFEERPTYKEAFLNAVWNAFDERHPCFSGDCDHHRQKDCDLAIEDSAREMVEEYFAAAPEDPKEPRPAPLRFRISIGDHHAEIQVSPSAPPEYNRGMVETILAEVVRRAGARPAVDPEDVATLDKLTGATVDLHGDAGHVRLRDYHIEAWNRIKKAIEGPGETGEGR